MCRQKSQHPVDLDRHLIGPAEEVGIVLREAAHARQAVQHAAALEAVDRAPLGEAQRQVAVRPRPALVDVDVERAVHRLQVELLPVDLDRRVHVVFVEIEVPARLPQRRATDVRRVDELVAAGQMLVFAELLGQVAHQPALRVPQHQPAADIVRVGAEQVQLAAQPAVIATLGLLQPM